MGNHCTVGVPPWCGGLREGANHKIYWAMYIQDFFCMAGYTRLGLTVEFFFLTGEGKGGGGEAIEGIGEKIRLTRRGSAGMTCLSSEQ